MWYKLKKIYMWVSNTTRWLPAEYQEVEYIQSSWTQYIDTWFYPTWSSEIEFDFMMLPSSWTGNFWVDSWWTSNAFSVFTDRILCYGSQYQNQQTYFTDNVKYKLEFKNLTCYLNWSQRFTYTAQTFTSSYSCYVFAKRRNNSIEMYAKCRVYGLKLWNNWTLEKDFVPCYRKSDDVIWMYDLVNNQFYTNSWTWTFTKWADIPDMVEKQVRPPRPAAYEISYDLRWGNLADLQAAWFDWVRTNGSYTFASDWLQQTSSSNDRGTWVIKKWLDLTNAKKLTAWHVWKWQYDSWSNGKDIKLCTDIITSSNDISLVNPRRDTYFTYANNSWYRNSELPYVNASWTLTVLARGIATSASWEDTITLTIDFENKTIEWKVAWTNNYTLSANLTDEQYNATRNMTAIYWWWWRWFHSYDSYERLKEVHLKIEY